MYSNARAISSPRNVYPASSFGGITSTKQMNTVYTTAIQLTAVLARPSVQTASCLHCPREPSPSAIGTAYATYSATVLRDVTTGIAPDHAMAAADASTTIQMAGPGVPRFGLTRRR